MAPRSLVVAVAVGSAVSLARAGGALRGAQEEVEATSLLGLPRPLRGIAYGALPCSPAAPCGGSTPSMDDMQVGYAAQWGASGRDDLAAMRALGGNAVRLYHSLGLNTQHDHGAFLDRAAQVGLKVLPGVHTDIECPDFDCFEPVRAAVLRGFQLGFRSGSIWHPAVATVVLSNEADLVFSPRCGMQSWCRVKAVLSALDGLLQAEKEAGVQGTVSITTTWSFAMATSVDGRVTAPGFFGFRDTEAAVANPGLGRYTPRTPASQLADAYRNRWVHSLNTQAPWSFVQDMLAQQPAGLFGEAPWFIGEYGANGQTPEVIESDLRSMDALARSGGSFLGTVVFQFQTAYEKGGSELNFGLFSLGREKVSQTDPVCDNLNTDCRSWPVYCRSTVLSYLPANLGRRAEAVALAWSGTVPASSSCTSF